MGNPTLGHGWQQLVTQLVEDLRRLDPDAALAEPAVDHHGLMRLRARFPHSTRAAGRKLLREYELRAVATCELCGGSGRVYAGPILIVRCASCREDDETRARESVSAETGA